MVHAVNIGNKFASMHSSMLSNRIHEDACRTHVLLQRQHIFISVFNHELMYIYNTVKAARYFNMLSERVASSIVACAYPTMGRHALSMSSYDGCSRHFAASTCAHCCFQVHAIGLLPLSEWLGEASARQGDTCCHCIVCTLSWVLVASTGPRVSISALWSSSFTYCHRLLK